MDNRTKILIALGASITANCQPCLRTALAEAEAMGTPMMEIFEAIAIGRLVRKGAASKIDYTVQTLVGEAGSNEEVCPFGSTEQDLKDWVNQEDAESQPECDCK